MEAPRVGRNDPCLCGSDKKFKHCCLRLDSGRDVRQLFSVHGDSAALRRTSITDGKPGQVQPVTDGPLSGSGMFDWQHLVRLSNRELARIDIAVMNLACAAGLPGWNRIDLDLCLRTLDTWAEQTRQFIEHVMPHFYSGRCDYPDSEPRFRIQAMITYLQRDLGLRFRFDKRSDDAILEPADSFLHGVILGKGGTCGSLPVLYAAIGRRLGYPLMLAMTRCHLYVRWDALPGGECFNIEASGDGVSFFPDEYYRTGHYAMPPETIQACGYLESLSPSEELASFLVQRGECWMQERMYGEAVTSFAWANELDPRRQQHAFMTWQAMRVWDEQLRAMLPPKHFPVLDIGLPPQYFARMPQNVESELIRMRVMEGLLRDPDYERRWWGPLRRNPESRPPGLPDRWRVDYHWNHGVRETVLNT